MMVGGWFVDDAKTFAANNAIEAEMALLRRTSSPLFVTPHCPAQPLSPNTSQQPLRL